MHTIRKLAKNELIRGLTMFNFEIDHLSGACAKGKQVHQKYNISSLDR